MSAGPLEAGLDLALKLAAHLLLMRAVLRSAG